MAIVVSAFLGAVGQLIFKYSVTGSLDIPLVIVGLLIYMASTAIYITVLSRTHLSWAYSLGGLSYIFAVLFAAVFLHEAVGARWIGVGLIAVGAALVGMS
jgi:uncharacterized membrane protein